MGKGIRRPKGPSIVDILALIPVAAQQVFWAFYIPLCVGIPIVKTRVKLSTNVTLSNPVFRI